MVLAATANGIAVFMVYGAGLVAGLLGQIGEALSSDTLGSVASTTSWALPFEALYQDALHRITAETRRDHGVRDRARPVRRRAAGGQRASCSGRGLLALAGAAAVALFARRDL